MRISVLVLFKRFFKNVFSQDWELYGDKQRSDISKKITTTKAAAEKKKKKKPCSSWNNF